MDVRNKTAIVTGGASGFGLHLAGRLIAQSCQVAVLDNEPVKLAQLREKYPAVLAVACDVSVSGDVERAVEEVYARFGSVDILVNNAGIMKSAPLVNFLKREDRRHSMELWDRVMAVNLNSVFYLTVNVADRMLAKRIRGVIVNVSSISAKGNAGQSAYSASKAGVEALTKVWAKELGPFGIRCAAIAPGFANTQGAADALEKETLDRWVGQVPLRRLGTIEEVVDAIMFAIGNDFFNGQILHIDGGLTL